MRRRVGRPGLMGTMARTAVIAGTATAVSGNAGSSEPTSTTITSDLTTSTDGSAATSEPTTTEGSTTVLEP